MNKNAVKLVDLLAGKYGSRNVTKKEIVATAEENGIPYPSWLFYNKSLRVSRGVYKIPGSSGNATATPTQQTATAAMQPNLKVVSNLAVETNGFSENLVPEKDSLFVPFGNFKTLKQVINSKMFYPVFITGLSGNGKTFGVEQACAQTLREVIRVNITVETDEDDLIGGFRLVDGDTKFFHGPVIKAMQKGAVLLLDEIDLGNPAKIMCLQSILEGKGYFIKKTGEYITPADGFTVVATANTKGKGSDDGRFIGTNILNEAFLERFPVTFEQEYPSVATEKKILGSVFVSLGVKDIEFSEKLVDWADIIRKTFYDGGVDEVVSTRRLVHIAKAYSIFNDRMNAIEMCTNRFDDDTKQSFMELYSKIDEGVNLEENSEVAPTTTEENMNI
jgi:hypothetical protein